VQLVFIHLGQAKVHHLVSNIERTHVLFPSFPINLIATRKIKSSELPDYIKVFNYKSSPEVEELFSSFGHDTKFRQGFWRFSLERLFALPELHKCFPDEGMLHIESDVLLLPNAPLDKISQEKELLWNHYNEDHDVSALLYSPSLSASNDLIFELEKQLRKDSKITDMTALSKIRKEKALNAKNFSSLNPEFAEMRNQFSNQIKGVFDGVGYQGIFDGAAIGMWLLGHDPRNNYGHSKIHDNSPILNGNSLVDPSSVGYELDDSGCLFAVSTKEKDIKLPIWNLHVHSKSKSILGKDWQSALAKYIDLASSPNEIAIYDRSVVARMLVDSLRGRTFLRFVLGSPPLLKIRRKLSPYKRYLCTEFRELNFRLRRPR